MLRGRVFLIPFFAFCFISLADSITVRKGSGAKDPYTVLGVKRTASIKQIKAAYRKKALETHPDKNKDADSDVATEKFREVVDAFEILSDKMARKRFDYQYNRQKQQQQHRQNSNNQQRRSQQQHRAEQQRREKEQQKNPKVDKMKHDPGVKQAQSRVMRINSFDHLTTVMLDENGRLERHLFMVFVADKSIEQMLDNIFLFPYPFAGMSKNDIWWEELLQSVKVRYNKPTDLTRFFSVPPNDHAKRSGKPFIIFIRKGDSLQDFNVYRTTGSNWNQRKKLEEWVYQQLKTTVHFRNNHSSPVEILLMDGGVPRLKATILPTSAHSIQATYSDQYVVRDTRVDKFPGGTNDWKVTEGSILGRWNIMSKNDIDITSKACMDMSGYCEEWINRRGKMGKQNECDYNYEFMRSVCPLSCQICKEDASLWFTIRNLSIIAPPLWLKKVTKKIHDSCDNMESMLQLQKNAAFTIVAIGVMIGLFLGVDKEELRMGRMTKKDLRTECTIVISILLLTLLILTNVSIMLHHMTTLLIAFVHDLTHIADFRKNAAASIFLIGCAVNLIPVIYRTLFVTHNKDCTMITKYFLPLMKLSIAVFIGITIMLCPFVMYAADMKDIWQIRKNVGIVILLAGYCMGKNMTKAFQCKNDLAFMIQVFLPALALIGLQYIILNKKVLLWKIGQEVGTYLYDLEFILNTNRSACLTIGVIGFACAFEVTTIIMWAIEILLDMNRWNNVLQKLQMHAGKTIMILLLLMLLQFIWAHGVDDVWSVSKKILQVYGDDTRHVINYRKNAALFLTVAGFCLSRCFNRISKKIEKMSWSFIWFLSFTSFFLSWLLFTENFTSLFSWLDPFDKFRNNDIQRLVEKYISICLYDIEHILAFRKASGRLLVITGVVASLLSEFMTSASYRRQTMGPRPLHDSHGTRQIKGQIVKLVTTICNILLSLVLTTVLGWFLARIFLQSSNTLTSDMRQIFEYRKNACMVITTTSFILARICITPVMQYSNDKEKLEDVQRTQLQQKKFSIVPFLVLTFLLIVSIHLGGSRWVWEIDYRRLFMDLKSTKIDLWHIFAIRRNAGITFFLIGVMVDCL